MAKLVSRSYYSEVVLDSPNWSQFTDLVDQIYSKFNEESAN
ncbi:Uncharacterised protein [Vibrio alginolyticus]|nr:hypothetical protein XM68_c21152 [Vibrio alginolyticus]SUQ35955.1 Uncharacterised protein [Vibrio alginolyticus]